VDSGQFSHGDARRWEERPLTFGGANERGVGVRQISVEFDRGPAAVSAARSALMPLDDRLEPAQLDDIRLLVSELVTNSVRHSGGSANGAVGLDIRVAPDRVRVEVTDPGDGFEPRPRAPGQSEGSGWGLFLVDRLSDRWGVSRRGKSKVWFEMDGSARLHPQAALQA
jgi:anti-sigma regulatory factor (Ser/Thr protein kinase)